MDENLYNLLNKMLAQQIFTLTELKKVDEFVKMLFNIYLYEINSKFEDVPF